MYTSAMNNSDKFRFVGATAKQSVYDTQQPSQPRKIESAFTMPAEPKRKKFGRRLFNWIIGMNSLQRNIPIL